MYEFFFKCSYVRVLLIDGGAVKKHVATVQEKKIQQPGTTFFNFSDKVAVPRGHENCCRFTTPQ